MMVQRFSQRYRSCDSGLKSTAVDNDDSTTTH
jgi:hypothetical protein